MGRRSRKRSNPNAPRPSVTRDQTSPAPASPPAPLPRRRARRGEAPPAPWGRFPLVELCVLAALVIGVIGLVRGDDTGRILLGCAMALGSLAGLELSVREHFAGYKSHTLILAGTVAVAVVAVLFFLRAPRFVLPPAAAVTFGLGFWLFRGVYRRRTDGLPRVR